jgi:hypothetical protein
MFRQLPTDVTSRQQQAIGTKKTMATIFFTGRKPIVLAILPRGTKFKQLYFVDYILLDLKQEKVNFHHRIP